MFIDIIFLMLAYLAFYQGFQKGLIRAVVSSASWFVAAVIALKFTTFTTNVLSIVFHLNNPPWLVLVALLLLFGGVWKGLHVFAGATESLLSIAHIGFVNRAAGGLLYTAGIMLVLSGILWFGDRARLLPESQKLTSRTYPALEQYPAKVMRVVEYTKPYMETSLVYFQSKLDELQGKVSRISTQNGDEPVARPADADEPN